MSGRRGLKTDGKPARAGVKSQKRSGSWYVFTDSHLGLAPNRDDVKLSGESCDPEPVGQFVNWLGLLANSTKIKKNDTKFNIKVWGQGRRIEHLKKPEKLIMLGDMQDIWDSTDREVEFCSRPVFNLIEKVDCEKIYITGNHDYGMHTLVGKHQSGKNPLTVTEKPYYVPPRRKLEKPHNKRYLFLHGMEFSPTFKWHSLWKHLGGIRSASLAHGNYGNVLVASIVLGLLLTCLQFPPFAPLIGGFLGLFLATTLFESFCRWYIVAIEISALAGAFSIPLLFWVLWRTPSDLGLAMLLLFSRVFVIMTLLLFLVGMVQPLLPDLGLAVTPLVLWMLVIGSIFNSGIWSYSFLIIVALVLIVWILKSRWSVRHYRIAGVPIVSSLCFLPLNLLLGEDLGLELTFPESLVLVIFLGIVMWAILGPPGIKKTHDWKWTALLILLLLLAVLSVFVLGPLWPSSESLLSKLSSVAGVVFGPPLFFVWFALGFPRLFYKCGIHVWRIFSRGRYQDVRPDQVQKYLHDLNKDSANRDVDFKDLVMMSREEDEEKKEKKGLFDDLTDLVLVFGHTHIMKQFSAQLPVKVNEAMNPNSQDKEKSKPEVDVSCLNVPSWIIDRSKREKHAQELRNAFLYIDPSHDEANPLFLGWDGEEQRPFHIPWNIVQERNNSEKEKKKEGSDSEKEKKEGGSLKTKWAPDLLSMGWPYKMIAEWVGWRRCIAKHSWWERIFGPDIKISSDVLFGRKAPKVGEELVMTPCCHKLMHRKHLSGLKGKHCPNCGNKLPSSDKEFTNWRRVRHVIKTWKDYNIRYKFKLTRQEICKKLDWKV